MPSHKFRVGQLVQLAPAISRNVPGGSYEIAKQLPENGGEFEYRIKHKRARASRGKPSCKAFIPLTPAGLLQFRTGLIRL